MSSTLDLSYLLELIDDLAWGDGVCQGWEERGGCVCPRCCDRDSAREQVVAAKAEIERQASVIESNYHALSRAAQRADRAEACVRFLYVHGGVEDQIELRFLRGITTDDMMKDAEANTHCTEYIKEIPNDG